MNVLEQGTSRLRDYHSLQYFVTCPNISIGRLGRTRWTHPGNLTQSNRHSSLVQDITSFRRVITDSLYSSSQSLHISNSNICLGSRFQPRNTCPKYFNLLQFNASELLAKFSHLVLATVFRRSKWSSPKPCRSVGTESIIPKRSKVRFLDPLLALLGDGNLLSLGYLPHLIY